MDCHADELYRNRMILYDEQAESMQLLRVDWMHVAVMDLLENGHSSDERKMKD